MHEPTNEVLNVFNRRYSVEKAFEIVVDRQPADTCTPEEAEQYLRQLCPSLFGDHEELLPGGGKRIKMDLMRVPDPEDIEAADTSLPVLMAEIADRCWLPMEGLPRLIKAMRDGVTVDLIEIRQEEFESCLI